MHVQTTAKWTRILHREHMPLLAAAAIAGKAVTMKAATTSSFAKAYAAAFGGTGTIHYYTPPAVALS